MKNTENPSLPELYQTINDIKTIIRVINENQQENIKVLAESAARLYKKNFNKTLQSLIELKVIDDLNADSDLKSGLNAFKDETAKKMPKAQIAEKALLKLEALYITLIEHAIVVAQSQMLDQHQKIEDLQAKEQEKDQKIEDLQAKEQEKDQKIEDLQAQEQEKDQKIVELQANIDQNENAQLEIAKKLAVQEELDADEVKQLQQSAAELKLQMQSKDDEIQKGNQKIQQLDLQTKQQKNEINDLTSKVKEGKEALDNLKTKFTQVKSALDDANSRNTIINEQNQKLGEMQQTREYAVNVLQGLYNTCKDSDIEEKEFVAKMQLAFDHVNAEIDDEEQKLSFNTGDCKAFFKSMRDGKTTHDEFDNSALDHAKAFIREFIKCAFIFPKIIELVSAAFSLGLEDSMSVLWQSQRDQNNRSSRFAQEVKFYADKIKDKYEQASIEPSDDSTKSTQDDVDPIIKTEVRRSFSAKEENQKETPSNRRL